MAEQTGPTTEQVIEQMDDDLMKMRDEPLHPDLVDWVEDGQWGPMLRHPLVYQIPLMTPGHANLAYLRKKELIAEAVEAEDWHTVVFLHERPYRLKALIDYCIGRFDIPDEGEDEPRPVPLVECPEHWHLAADVWVDSENIEQNVETWRLLIDPDDTLLEHGAPDLWLGTDEERAEFDALPDPIPAWRGGIVGDWSWTTDIKVAEFFARRLGADRQPRHALIPKSDCFGYLTRRGESELLVRLTPEREHLVYPDGVPDDGE